MKKVIYLVAILLVSVSTLFAQEDHKHGSPHGGEVKAAGQSMHIELLIKDNTLLIYVLNAQEKPWNGRAIPASLKLQTTDGKILNPHLVALSKNSFSLKLNPALKYNKAIVSIKDMSKTTVSASFDLNKKAPIKTHNTAKKAHTH